MKASSFIAAIPLLAIALYVPAGGAPIISGAYYEENVTRTCPPNITCTAVFSAAPKRVLITRAACLVVTASTVRTIVMGVSTPTTGETIFRHEFLPIPPNPVVYLGENWYSAVWSADLLLGTGRIPAISAGVFPSNGITIQCKITGGVQP